MLHKNSALGLEKQYSEYMAQGRTVDYGIVSPAHMSAFSKAAPFINAPFLFRDIDHWNSVLNQDILKPVAEGVEQRAWSSSASSRVPPTWRSSELGPVPGAACDG